MSRHWSLVSPDIQNDVSGPTFQRMTELVKIWMRWLLIYGLDDKFLGLDGKLHGSGDKLHDLNEKSSWFKW